MLNISNIDVASLHDMNLNSILLPPLQLTLFEFYWRLMLSFFINFTLFYPNYWWRTGTNSHFSTLKAFFTQTSWLRIFHSTAEERSQKGRELWKGSLNNLFVCFCVIWEGNIFEMIQKIRDIGKERPTVVFNFMVSEYDWGLMVLIWN